MKEHHKVLKGHKGLLYLKIEHHKVLDGPHKKRAAYKAGRWQGDHKGLI
jgi:hypothetical protein